MSDIIEELRALAFVRPIEKCIHEAADEIQILRKENARLREAVAPFVDAGNFKVFINTASTEEECFVSINVKERDLRRARAAIREGGKE